MSSTSYEIWSITEDLLNRAQDEYAVGQPFDKADFCDSIREICEYLFSEEKLNEGGYDKFDMKTYGCLFAYASIPTFSDDEDHDFYISKKIVGDIADAMVNPEIFVISENSITCNYYPGEETPVTYNFVEGDFSEYVEIIKRMDDMLY